MNTLEKLRELITRKGTAALYEWWGAVEEAIVEIEKLTPPAPKPRPMCDSCGAPDACDKDSGQGKLCGISACKDCFMEWYDGDRPASPDRESWQAVGDWVKLKRAKANAWPVEKRN